MGLLCVKLSWSMASNMAAPFCALRGRLMLVPWCTWNWNPCLGLGHRHGTKVGGWTVVLYLPLPARPYKQLAASHSQPLSCTVNVLIFSSSLPYLHTYLQF